MTAARRKRPARRRGRPVSRANIDIREQLLDAATHEFAERGVAASTMTSIAVRVGVTPAMVHYYFRNRRQLLDAVVDERLARFVTGVWAPVGTHDAPAALVRGLVNRIVEGAAARPWLPPLWIREVVSEGGQLRERALKHLPVEQMARVAEGVRAAQQAGVVHGDIDPRLLFLSIIGLTLLPLATTAIWRRVPATAGIDSRDIARHATALLLHGLIRSPT
jgi:AcrR family transcriptional regulator